MAAGETGTVNRVDNMTKPPADHFGAVFGLVS